MVRIATAAALVSTAGTYVSAFSPVSPFTRGLSTVTSSAGSGNVSTHGSGCPCGSCSQARHGASCKCASCARVAHSMFTLPSANVLLALVHIPKNAVALYAVECRE
eukprot:scaffold150_cov151-Skeletonema_menzelii.AAC.3